MGTSSGAPSFLAQSLIQNKNFNGVGAPGHWTIQSNVPTWVPVQPVTTAPANAVTLPAPIRSLLPNEQIVHLPGSLFTQAGTWVVERMDLPQTQQPETEDQQFADVKAALVAIFRERKRADAQAGQRWIEGLGAGNRYVLDVWAGG